MTKRLLLVITILSALMFSCGNGKKTDDSQTDVSNSKQKIAVLLVSHGSVSAKWREMLLAIEDSVKTEVMTNNNITVMRSAFMEYNGPSIADRMKEFDNEGFTDVLIVPVFLTVSSHSFDDIPTIVGLKSEKGQMDKLKSEKIECYKAKANIKITELLDFSDILQNNVIRRVKQLSEDVSNEAVALIAYGDTEYNDEWSSLMDKLGTAMKNELGIENYGYDWCGHIVHYDKSKTTNIVDSLLNIKEKVIVIPILVAFDEMFQIDIIGGGLDKVKNRDNVAYKPDAILPDENLEDWIITSIHKGVDELAK